MVAQSSVKMEINFTKKIENKITLSRLRERTQISIFNKSQGTLKAKLICKIEREGEILYQTGTHNAPILSISAGENMFEGDVAIPMDEVNKILLLDSNVHLTYDLFFLKETSSLQHVTLNFSINSKEDGSLEFIGEEVIQKNKYRSFNDFKSNLTDKIISSNVSNGQGISESVAVYMQMQQAIASAYEGYKFKTEEGH